jgi:type VI secretion system protein VasJ
MSNAVEAIEVRMNALTAPIPGPKPDVGEDLSFDAEFEQVKVEIEKLGQVANIPPNWQKVTTMGATLLGRSKDMRLATWFAVGKMNQTGWTGLAEGLVVLRALTRKHWDGMYPERRPRARANLFAWLTEQVTTVLGSRTAGAPDRDSVIACEVLFKDLDGVLSEKLGELHPGLGTVRSLMASCLATAPVAPPERPIPAPPPLPAPGATPSVPPPRTADGGPVAAPPAAPVVGLQPPAVATASNVGEVKEVLSKCRDAIVSAATLVRTQDHTKPWSYHLQRAGIWLSIDALPRDAVIPPPAPRVREELEGHATGMRWLRLLQEAETLTGSFLFWFDLHRYVATALEHLGPDCLDAMQVVRRTVTAFVDRFPTLPTLTFKGAIPFANSATQAWIDEGRGGGGARGVHSVLAEQKAEVDQRVDAARQAVLAGRVGDGVGLLVELARSAPEGRAGFEMGVQAAQMALDAQKPTLARPILEGLVRQIETHGLEAWEPSRCVTVYAALLSAIRATKPPIVDASQREAFIIDKLCRLDPALAVRLGV